MKQTRQPHGRTNALEYQVRHEAIHDALTELPNRILFRDRLEQAIHAAQRDKTVLAVLILSLGNLQDLNDALGSHQGDCLLKHVANRLRHVIREADTLARTDDHEFAIILRQIHSKEDVITVMKKIDQSLFLPYLLNGSNVNLVMNTGGALFPRNGTDADTLLDGAGAAVCRAKQEARVFVLYSEQLDHDISRRLTFNELRHAIRDEELTLRYQPIMNSQTYTIGEVEVLVRWEHKRYGLLMPEEFIPLAQQFGLIHSLTLWVIKHALRQQSEWRKLGLEVGMSINISAQALLNPELPEQISQLLADCQTLPKHLILEITESSIMFNQELAAYALSRFAEMGIKIAVDDFGTGYSSLKYLKNLPVSQLKIDKSFVLDMLENENDEIIVNATIDLGHDLGLEVVAEGVESAEVFRRLRAQGCDAVQGYHINYPLRSEDLIPWYYSDQRLSRSPGITAES